MFTAHAQQKRWVHINNANYDSKTVTFGLALGLHSNAFRINYASAFATHQFDTLYSVAARWSPGFSMGGLVNLKIAGFFDLRCTPQFSFYDYRLDYLFTDRTPARNEVVERVLVELPLLLKYKSERRGNIRMYMIGGVKPGIEASGLRDVERVRVGLETKEWNLTADFGFGFDLYYPLFKFSPEIRFSKGVVNVLDNTTNAYGQPLERLTTNTVHVYFIFQ
jgi:hypothetical protein